MFSTGGGCIVEDSGYSILPNNYKKTDHFLQIGS
jgi:hypothetical protein